MDFVSILMSLFVGIVLLLLMVNGAVFFMLSRKNKKEETFKKISNKYTKIEEVQKALQSAGLIKSNLILGIDFTASNIHTGRETFGGKNLHDLSLEFQPNPYQQVIQILGRTLEPFDEDKFIPTYGFGDSATTDRTVFAFFPDGKTAEKPSSKIGFERVLERYQEVLPTVKMAGPTNFAPLIREAIEICKKHNSYHILVIIADGQVTCEKDTKDAIVEASAHPLSILQVGVGDGPWHTMKKFDNELPKRKFDNFQFVNFHEVKQRSAPLCFEANFALEALMEVPVQFKQISALGYLQPQK